MPHDPAISTVGRSHIPLRNCPMCAWEGVCIIATLAVIAQNWEEPSVEGPMSKRW